SPSRATGAAAITTSSGARERSSGRPKWRPRRPRTSRPEALPRPHHCRPGRAPRQRTTTPTGSTLGPPDRYPGARADGGSIESARGARGARGARALLLLQRLLADRLVAGGPQATVVLARLVLALLLHARTDRGPDVLRGVPEGLHQVHRVHAQPRQQPVDVAGHGPGALGAEPAVDQIPVQVLLDQRESEQVPQPGHHGAGVGIDDPVDGLGERLPLQQFA